MNYLVIITIFFALQILSEIIQFTKNDINGQNDYNVVFETSLPSWQACIKFCGQFGLCDSINFIRSKKICQLLNQCIGLKKLQITSDSTFAVYNKDIQNDVMQCHANQCKPNSLCVPTTQNITCQPMGFEELDCAEHLKDKCGDKCIAVWGPKNKQKIPMKVPGGLCYGKIIFVSVTPGPTSFKVVLMDGWDMYGFCLSFRFNSNTLIFTTKDAGKWMSRISNPFPTDLSQHVEISILVDSLGYQVTVNQQYSYEFPHIMLPVSRFGTLHVMHNATVNKIAFQYCSLL